MQKMLMRMDLQLVRVDPEDSLKRTLIVRADGVECDILDDYALEKAVREAAAKEGIDLPIDLYGSGFQIRVKSGYSITE